MIPYDADAFFALFAAYNTAIWPAQPAAYALGLLVLVAMFRRFVQRDRLAAAALVVMWAFNAVAYHWTYFATINFLAPVFAAAFAAQALLLAWSGVGRGRLHFAWRGDPAGWIGLTLMLFALVGYPAWTWYAGHRWPDLPMFGIAPGPTTIFTLGALLAGRATWPLFVIPLLWCAVGGSAAWLLDVPQDLSLPAAAAVTLIAIAVRRH
ncbi:MAG: DUF6064 family protein [Alphaproteobacteria bacterium]